MPTDLFALRSDLIPPSARVVAFTGSEAISRAYHFEIFVIVPQADGELDADTVLGKAATLEINDESGTPRRWYHGVLASLELQHDLGVDLLYRVELVPRLWELTLSHHSRVYANETFHKVAERVLKTANLKKDEDFSIAFPPGKPYEHLTEYRESHFDFLNRVMEREGYYYYFEQRDTKEFLVISNAKGQQPDCAPAETPFFATGASDTSAVEAVRSFRMRAVAMPTNVRLREYDPLQPDANLTGTADVPHAVAGQLDYFGDNYTSQGDGNRIAGFRKEELQSRQKRFYGTGRVFNLAAGHYFTLEQHGRLDGRYLVTEIRHVGSNFAGASTAQQRLGFDSDTSYRVDFAAIDAEQQFRPPRVTPVPRIYGVEEAVICGAATSPYAQIDAHGRYKVKIHFDEGDLVDGKASTWVRMIQPHGGNPEGMHFPLRKGTEVLLVYLGGDPDRPVIAGAAHNTNKPSVVTESNHTLNVIHTGSDNRIEMEDAQGAQYIDISTPPMNTHVHLGATHGPHTHNFVVSTDGTGLIHTGQSLDVTVDDWKHEIVTNYVDEDYDNNHFTTVKGVRHEIVEQDVIEEYKTTLSTTVDAPVNIHYKSTLEFHTEGDAQETYDATLTSTVTGALQETYDGGQTTNVTKGQTVTVLGGASHTYDKLDSKVTGDVFGTILGTDLTFKMANSSDTVVGVKNENHIGLKIETLIGGKIEGFIGVKMETALAAKIELAASLELLSKTAQFEMVGMKIKKKEAEMGNVSITIVQQSLTVTQVAMFIVA
ncbi:MAG: type VI secretion system tip protein TssI/VgrG [Polyangiales bacterium]